MEHKATPVWPCSLCPRLCHQAQAGGPGFAAKRGLAVRLGGRAPTHSRPPDPGGSGCVLRAGAVRAGLRPHTAGLRTWGVRLLAARGRRPLAVGRRSHLLRSAARRCAVGVRPVVCSGALPAHGILLLAGRRSHLLRSAARRCAVAVRLVVRSGALPSRGMHLFNEPGGGPEYVAVCGGVVE